MLMDRRVARAYRVPRVTRVRLIRRDGELVRVACRGKSDTSQ